jgi:hypothetical protein
MPLEIGAPPARAEATLPGRNLQKQGVNTPVAATTDYIRRPSGVAGTDPRFPPRADAFFQCGDDLFGKLLSDFGLAGHFAPRMAL